MISIIVIYGHKLRVIHGKSEGEISINDDGMT